MEQGAEDVPVIYLHEIKRQYMQGETTLTILNGAKLALWAGQSVALVAPSGSGKSTLLHIAGLLESPDDGEVYVGGAPTSQLSDMDRTQIRRADIHSIKFELHARDAHVVRSNRGHCHNACNLGAIRRSGDRHRWRRRVLHRVVDLDRDDRAGRGISVVIGSYRRN